MAPKMKRMVIIGLGGTGMDAALNVKRRLLRLYGEIPTMYKFLMIDTDDFSPQMENGVDVSPTRSEFLKLEVQDPARMKDVNKEVKEWWTKVPSAALRSLTTGAKAIRPLGRLAAFANAKDVYRKIKSVIDDVKSAKLDQMVEGKFEVSENVLISIVGSIAGGTGSGTLMDISFVARQFLTDKDKLYLYILLPDAFVGKAFVKNAEPNTYGALKEIDHFLSLDSEVDDFMYRFGGQAISVSGRPWNLVFLVNDMKRNGEKIDSIGELTEVLGTGIFLSGGSTGKKAYSMFDNMEGEMAVAPKWFGKNANYCSFGTSELVLPREETVATACNKIALGVLDRLSLGGKSDNIGSDADNLVDAWQIREDTDDQVIDALAGPSDCRRFSVGEESYSKEAFEDLKRSRTKFVDQSKKSLAELCNSKCDDLTKSVILKVQEAVSQRVNKKAGISYATALVSSLVGRIEQFQTEMKNEKIDLTAKLSSFRSRYKGVEASLGESFKSFLGRKKKVLAGFSGYADLVNHECRTIMEIERRDAAVRFFAALLNTLGELKEQLTKVNSYIASLLKDFNTDLQSLLNAHRKPHSFQYRLNLVDIVDLNTLNKSVDEFLLWLKSTQDKCVLDFGALRLSDMKAVLLAYAKEQREVIALGKLTVEDVLKSLDEARLAQIIKEIDKMAVPLWNYNQGYIGGDLQTTDFFIFGVPDAEKSILSEDFLKQHLAAKADPDIVSTGDPLRVICYKAEAPLPAFVVNNMSTYRDKYFGRRKDLSFHIDRRWEEEFADLFPPMDENRQWWSLGNADCFNLIKKTGNFYRVKSMDRGSRTSDHWLDLMAGRVEAMNMFLKDDELVSEVKKKVEEISDSIGHESISEQLNDYTVRLGTMAKKSTKEIKAQIDKELDDIEEYVFGFTHLT